MKANFISPRNIAALLILIVSISTALAQPKLQQAKNLQASFNYKEAIDMYNEAFKTTPPGIIEARDMAKCFLMINDSRSSEIWLAKVNSFTDKNNQDILLYANTLKANGKYKEAIGQYQDLAEKSPSSKEKTNQAILSCQKAIEWMNDSSYINVSNVKALNSDKCDFGLIPAPNGFILTSDRKIEGKNYKPDELFGWTGNPYLKLFSVPSLNSASPSPKTIDAINNEFHNGPGNFDNNSSTFFFTRTKMMKVPKKPVNNDPTSFFNSLAGDYTNRLEIFFVKNNNGNWGTVMPFKYNNAMKHSVGHPALSPDGKILYFVSDMEGGVGGTDIYFCELLPDGQWSEPQNAGKKINTEGKEVFPFVDKNGVLYFSSDGHPGMGGLDLFSAKGSKNNWSEPANLKYPINSPKDDFSIFVNSDTKSGYLASNREGGKGEDDIYFFEESMPKVLILAISTKERLPNNVVLPVGNINLKIIDLATNKEKIISTDAKGKLYLLADCGAKYSITSIQNEFFTQSTQVETKCFSKKDTAYAELVLDRIILNKPIVIENIYYDFNKSDIRPDAAIELDKIVAMLNKNPQISIELSSHTDCRGKDEYNEKLSQRRATAAVEYIVSKGIASDRITAKGYGERMLLNRCANGVKCSEEEHQMNRRTEFKVTSINTLSQR